MFKRILAGIVMAICTFVIIAAVAGLIGVWAMNTPVTTALLNLLTTVDNALVRVDTGVTNFNQQLGSTQQGLAELTTRVETLGQNVAENTIILNAIEARWGDDLAPKVDNLRQTAQIARDTVVGIQATIEAINSIPFVSLPLPDGDALQQISDSAAAVRENAQTFRAEVTAKKVDTATILVERLTQSIERISNGLQKVQTGLAALDERVTQALTKIRWLQAQVPVWVDWFSVISTILLLWLILSQVSLFAHAYRVLRPEDTPVPPTLESIPSV